jgi:hypothetical protein
LVGESNRKSATLSKDQWLPEIHSHIDISKWLDFRVFSDKDVKIVGTSDSLSIGQ